MGIESLVDLSGNLIKLPKTPPDWVTPSVETQFSCGHHEIVGGRIADPLAIISEVYGMKTFKASADSCSQCTRRESNRNANSK